MPAAAHHRKAAARAGHADVKQPSGRVGILAPMSRMASAWQVETKGRYGHPGGLVHAGLHGLLSLPVLMVAAPPAPGLFAALVVAEVVLHAHIDRARARIAARRGIDGRDKRLPAPPRPRPGGASDHRSGDSRRGWRLPPDIRHRERLGRCRAGLPCCGMAGGTGGVGWPERTLRQRSRSRAAPDRGGAPTVKESSLWCQILQRL
ncbi:MAG: hypothetical protein U5K36_07465 [Roseovarius sp.]|nr:hypothetical protein [Roseovarius sp.]